MRTSHGTYVALPLAQRGLVKHSPLAADDRRKVWAEAAPSPFVVFAQGRSVLTLNGRMFRKRSHFPLTRALAARFFLRRIALLRRMQIFSARIGICFDLRNPWKGFAHLLVIAEVAHRSRPRRQRLVV